MQWMKRGDGGWNKKRTREVEKGGVRARKVEGRGNKERDGKR